MLLQLFKTCINVYFSWDPDYFSVGCKNIEFNINNTNVILTHTSFINDGIDEI